MYQDDGFGQVAGCRACKRRTKRKLVLVAAAGYERNTDRVEGAVTIKASDAQVRNQDLYHQTNRCLRHTKAAAARSCTTLV
jgi:hypothetical protein